MSFGTTETTAKDQPKDVEMEVDTKTEDSKDTEMSPKGTESEQAKGGEAKESPEKLHGLEANMFADESDGEQGKKILKKRKKKNKSPEAEVQKKLKEPDATVPEKKTIKSTVKAVTSDDGLVALEPVSLEPPMEEESPVSPLKNSLGTGEDGAADAQSFGEPTVGCVVHPPIDGLGGTKADANRRRLLAWNDFGAVMQVAPPPGEEWNNTYSYEVDHSTTSERFRHNENLEKCAIGKTGVIFGCDKIIKIFAFGGNGRKSNKWELELRDGVNVHAVGICDDYVAICTNRCGSTLQIMSLGSGLVAHIVSLPGSVVTCCGNGNLLAIVYNSGASVQVKMLEFKAENPIQVFDVPVCLGTAQTDFSPVERRVHLKWCYISDNGNMYAMDANKHVRMLIKTFGTWQWTPVVDLSVSGMFRVHPHSVDEDLAEESIMLAKLTGEAFPMAPRPMLEKRKIVIPIAGKPSKKEEAFATNEEILIRKSMFFATKQPKPGVVLPKAERKELKKRNKELEKARITLFSEALKLHEDAKALEVAKSIKMQKVLIAASTLAYEHGLHRVAEQIKTLIQERANEAKKLEAQRLSAAQTPVSSAMPTPIASKTPGGGEVKKNPGRFGAASGVTKKRMFGASKEAAEADSGPSKKRKANPFSRK